MKLINAIRETPVGEGELAICWLGQAGFCLKDAAGRMLMLDPYLTNCGQRMRGFKRLSACLIDPAEVAPQYYITTHIHFDHFDMMRFLLLHAILHRHCFWARAVV